MRPRLYAARLGQVACFVIALFASAFLLFALEPLVSRLVLPRLGGSPAVWNTCVCFFQAGLLLGYLYAHIATSRLGFAAQVCLHAAILSGALALLPLSLGSDAPPPDADPVVWLLHVLTLRVGPLFVAIGATAPLLQAWFSRTTHRHARDPYFLYAASNAGSLAALLSYPVLIETNFGLIAQSRLWSLGFAATAAAVVLCGAVALRDAAPPADHARASPASAVPVTERLRWLALAFVPSGLMLAVTTHITTDIASVPLFWIAPLALYILTFVVAFGWRQRPVSNWLGWIQAVGLIAAACVPLLSAVKGIAALLVPLLAFTATAAACHIELARRRPDPSHLTGYFMLISLGGALGGWFCGLLAPLLFNVPLEYPILLVAAATLRAAPARLPTPAQEDWARRGDIVLPLTVGVAIILSAWAGRPAAPPALRSFAELGIALLPAALLIWMARRRVRLAAGLAMCFAVPLLVAVPEKSARSFFGVFRIRTDRVSEVVKLEHGTTLHGVESTRPGEALVPLSYYNQRGPFGRLLTVLRNRPSGVTEVGVVGLGTGAMACYARPGETWVFREIDPLAEALARDPRWFHFMSGCGADASVVLGDARLTLSADPASRYDLLMIDAFSSDSVPVHLLTREALALYLSQLKPGGIVVFHVSNRFLDLVPVVAGLAVDAGAPVRHLLVKQGSDTLREPGTEAVAIGLPGETMDDLGADGWDVPAPGPVLWTDDRSDILGVIRWR